MSYQKDRDEFVGVMVEEGEVINQKLPIEKRTYDGVALARLILRNAATIQRLAVDACNRELSKEEIKRGEDAEKRISDACKPWGIVPNFNGDPRGCCVKLILPSGRWNSFGGAEDGFCVPVR